MTQVQRKKHVESINNQLESAGFIINRFGIYHKDNIKIDTRDNNIKIWKGDFKRFSKPIVQIVFSDIVKYLS